MKRKLIRKLSLRVTRTGENGETEERSTQRHPPKHERADTSFTKKRLPISGVLTALTCTGVFKT